MAPAFGSDPRVDTLAIQSKYGLLSEGEEVRQRPGRVVV